jgi:hypothetical protein
LNPGSVSQRGEDQLTAPPGQGTATAGNPANRGDDSFAGEVSLGEAAGEDNPVPPSADDPD